MFDKQTPGALVQTWRVAAAAAALALACAALAIVAYSRPATRPATDEIAYVHRGDFSYGAAAPSGPVYEKGVVTTGDPVYLRLVSRVDVRFKYRFEAGGPHEVAGTVGLHAEVSDSTGWRRSVPLGEPVPFAGSEAEVGAPFDIGRAQALVAEVQALTGVSGGTYAVALVPEVSVTGKVADHELGDTFAPRLEFVLDPLQLRLNVSGSEGRAVADALSPRTEGSVTRRVSRPAELGVGGIAIGVGQARNVAALLGVPAVIASAVALGMLRRRWRGEPSLIELRHGRRLVPVVDAHREGNRAHVEVASMADLVRLAERHDSLVLHQPTDEADAYVFTADRVVYRYLARGSLRRSG